MKRKRWLKTVPFAVLSLGCLAGAAACQPAAEPTEGPETGIYYYDADDGQYYIYLNSGNRFTFLVKDTSESGSYAIEEGELRFDFGNDGEIDATARLESDVLTVTYGNETLAFRKKVNYTVRFETNGGSAVGAATVWNGRTLAKPADPTREGYHFIGWYTDETVWEKEFKFGETAIVSDLTLYARWEAALPTQSEYTVTLDYGYEGKTESKQTISGKLFDLESPTRSGYRFAGWWMSSYEDGERLTDKYAPETVFTTARTLYAVWEKDGDPAAPELSVSAERISWNSQSGAGTLTIEGPTGFATKTETIGATAGTSYAIDFGAQPAGDYVIRFTVNGRTTTRYYRNKSLDRVWNFTVINGTLLLFNAVEHAQKYVITVDCGDKNHTHEEFDNGNSTSFDFTGCPMQPGGIEFTVVAKADANSGYADSVAGKYTYNNLLDEVSGYYLDEETDTLIWTGVANAASYMVKVTVDGEEAVGWEDIGNKTSYSLKEYTGEIVVSVYAKTSGYNSPTATEYAYHKTRLATPGTIRIIGDELTWTGVKGASGYQVRIGSREISSKTPSLDLSDETLGLDWTRGEDYKISVKATGLLSGSESQWSEEYDARYYAMYQTLTYYRNEVSWHAVIGAVKYEVMVNNVPGSVQTITDGSTSAGIALTKSGTNTISVRFSDGTTTSAWVELEVTAYEIALDSNGGSEVSPLYVATGDKVELPSELTKAGYDFASWYKTPGGSSANGEKYVGEYYTGTGDIRLYADWTNATYEVKLNYGEYGTSDEDPTVGITYLTGYELPVPTITDGRKVFKGWYAQANGKGIKYTDETGKSVNVWMHTAEGYTLYAYYVDGLEYVESGDGYVVRAGDSIAQITNLYIPKEYEGKPVTEVAEYAFQKCTSLETVSIPNTISSIADTAFEGCTKVMQFIVRDEGAKAEEQKYFSVEGTLIEKGRSGSYDLKAAPLATTGVYTVPDMVTRIPQNAFKSMTGVTEVKIPSSVTNVVKEAFVSCSKLTTITFLEPEEGATEVLPLNLAVDFIGASCTAITTINLPARLGLIDQSEKNFSEAFVKLTKLKAINVATGDNYSSIDGVLCNAIDGRIGDTILYCPLGIMTGKTDTSYTIPTEITKIADMAFAGTIATSTTQPTSGYNGITKLIFHDHMTEIGEKAFYNNRKVTEIVFQASENYLGFTIGKEAFYWCTSVITLTFEEEGTMKSRQATDDEGKAYTEYYFEATKSCGVLSIGENAFYGCLESTLLLPSTLTYVAKNAFSNNTKLTDLDLSHISTSIDFGDAVFDNCSGLTKVEITENIGYLEFSSIFYNCANLSTLSVDENSPYYSSDSYGVLYNKNKTKISYCPNALSGVYEIPDTVITIGGAVFKDKMQITSITIPVSVETIGMAAFEGCTGLTGVTFVQGEGKPLSIGEKAFYGCSNLTSAIVLPLRTVTIGASAFYAVASASIELNEGLESIGDEAFYQARIASVSIPDTVKTIGKQAFFGCTQLKEVTFVDTRNGETLVELTVDNNTFEGCTKLLEIVLPERLLYVSDGMFKDCALLKSVVIPTTVGNTDTRRGVGAEAFSGCTSLNTLSFTKLSDIYTAEELATVTAKPLSFGKNAFNQCFQLKTLTLPNRLSGFNSANDVFEFYTTSSGITYEYNISFAPYNDTALINAAGVNRIEVEEGGEFSSYDGVLYTKDLGTVLFCPYMREGAVEIAYQATTFEPSAFRYCKYVTAITFQDTPAGVEEVAFSMADAYPVGYNQAAGVAPVLGNYVSSTHVFFNCSNLTSIAFPARLKSIGAYALSNDLVTPLGDSYKTGLNAITFADGCQLTDIGEYAFSCTDISKIILPTGVTGMGTGVFYNCKKLTDLTLSEYLTASDLTNIIAAAPGIERIAIPSGNENLLLENNTIYNAEKTTILYVLPSLTAEEYVVPATVTKISSGAFSNVKNVKAVSFAVPTEGDVVLSLEIEDSAFAGGLIASIELPARLQTMGEKVFQNCASLTAVTFAEGFGVGEAGCKTLPDYTFDGCASLGTIEIPYTVTSLGNYIFRNCSAMTEILFEENTEFGNQLAQIGTYAFQNCVSLPAIALPRNVNDLGAEERTDYPGYLTTDTYTFDGCTNLKTVVLSDSIKFLGAYMFQNCTSLQSVALPANLKAMGRYAFINCRNLTELTIPGGSVGQYAFQGCTSLQTVYHNGSGEEEVSIGAYAFANLNALNNVYFSSNSNVVAVLDHAFYRTGITTLNLPDSVRQLGGSVIDDEKLDNTNATYIFGSCLSLTSIRLSPNIKELPYGSFYGCTSLLTVDFQSESVMSTIGEYAFYGCSALQNLTIPGSVTLIKSYAFQDCRSMGKVQFGENSILETVYKYAFSNCRDLTEIILPDSLSQLGGDSSTYTSTTTSYVFQNCTSLTSIRLPDSLTTIGSNAFDGCKSLVSVDFNKLEDIGNYAFRNCTMLGSAGTLDLSSVRNIGTYAFYGCSSLNKISITSVDSIGRYAFQGTKYELIPTDESNLTIKDEMIYDLVSGKFILYLGSAETLTIPEGITEISGSAFYGCTTLTEVVLPATVSTVGEYAFYGCTNLQTVNLEKVSVLGKYAFAYSGIQEADLGNLTSMGTDVFLKCASLAEVRSDSSFDVSVRAFQYCTSLATVEFTKITALGISSFDGCSSLEKIDLPDTVTRFISATGGDYSKYTNMLYTFRNCTSLKSIRIPVLLTQLPKYTFQGCTALETVDLNKITIIGENCFENCTSLKNCDFSEVVHIYNYAFRNTGFIDLQLSFQVLGTASMFGKEAFANCVNLVTLSMPNFKGYTGLSTYSSQFSGCTSLKEVSMPNAQYIAGSMFKGCISLTSFEVPSTMKIVYASAFEGCTSLETFSYAAGATVFTTINKSAFFGCTALSSVTLPSSVTAIQASVFAGCTALKSFDVPEKVKIIYANLFEGCTSLSSVTFAGTNVTTIQASAFAGCASLETIDLSEQPLAGTTTTYNASVGILANAFDGCTKLKTVILGAVNNIHVTAFDNCPEVELIWSNDRIREEDGMVYDSTTHALIKYTGTASTITLSGEITSVAPYAFYGNTTLREINLNNVATLGSYAFYGNTNLISVNLGKVTTINEYTFFGCSSLETIDLSAITKFGNYAFADCVSLKAVDLSAVTSYGNCGTYTFSGCTNLSDVVWKSTITSVNTGLFQNCSSLSTFDFSKISTIYGYAFQGTGFTELTLPSFSSPGSGSYQFADCTKLEKVTAPKLAGSASYGKYMFANCTALKEAYLLYSSTSNTYVPYYAFDGCINLTTFETNLPYIGEGAFRGCTSLTEAVFPNVTMVLKAAYEGCESLTKVSFPMTTSLGTNAFSGCKNLAEAYLPKASIGESAFDGCTLIASFDFSNVKYVSANAFRGTSLTEIELPEAVTLGAGCFSDCKKLTKITLSAFVGSTNYYGTTYRGQFIGCTALKEAIMPLATYVPAAMFQGCAELTTLTAPSVIGIYDDAFDGCVSLRDCGINFMSVVSIGENAFKDCTAITSVTLGSECNMYSNSFAGWTAEQTIVVTRFALSDLSETFVEQWNNYCKATVIWADGE